MRLGENLELILRNRDTNKVLETWNLAEIAEERVLANGTYLYSKKGYYNVSRVLMMSIGETILAKLKKYRPFSIKCGEFYRNFWNRWQEKTLGRKNG